MAVQPFDEFVPQDELAWSHTDCGEVRGLHEPVGLHAGDTHDAGQFICGDDNRKLIHRSVCTFSHGDSFLKEQRLYCVIQKMKRRTAAGGSSTGVSPRPILVGASHSFVRSPMRVYHCGRPGVMACRLPNLPGGRGNRSALAKASWRISRPARPGRNVSVFVCCAQRVLFQGALYMRGYPLMYKDTCRRFFNPDCPNFREFFPNPFELRCERLRCSRFLNRQFPTGSSLK